MLDFRRDTMKKRTRLLVLALVIIATLLSALPVFAVGRVHPNRYNSSQAYVNMSGTCCGSTSVALKVRATYRPILEPSASTAYSYGTYLSGSNSLYGTASVPYPSTNAVVGASHYCYARCNNCNALDGAYYGSGYSNTYYPYH